MVIAVVRRYAVGTHDMRAMPCNCPTIVGSAVLKIIPSRLASRTAATSAAMMSLSRCGLASAAVNPLPRRRRPR